MSCDCWIGILNSYDQGDGNDLHLGNVNDRLKEVAVHSFTMASFSNSFKGYHPKDYIDRRRGLSTLFNFCPECGEKINWRKVRKGVL